MDTVAKLVAHREPESQRIGPVGLVSVWFILKTGCGGGESNDDDDDDLA